MLRDRTSRDEWMLAVYVRTIELVCRATNMSPSELFAEGETPATSLFQRMVLYITRLMTDAPYSDLGWLCGRSLDSAHRAIKMFEKELKTKQSVQEWYAAVLDQDDFPTAYRRNIRKLKRDYADQTHESCSP